MTQSILDKHFSQVSKALKMLEIQASSNQVELFLKHLLLLQKWNKAYNMTAITAIDEMLTKHLFDSLAIAPFITGESIIDVGTGAGFPGIPLAILRPDKNYVLIDSVAKKIRFLNYVKGELKLDNITPIHMRIQDYQAKIKFDHVLSRAFSSVQNFYKLCQPLVRKNGSLLAMKGADTEVDQLQSLPIDYGIIQLRVPFLAAKRHLVVMNSN